MVPGKDYIAILKKVRGRKRDHFFNLVGDPNKNPILYIIIYEPEFPDIHVEEYKVNIILETFWNKFILMDVILSYYLKSSFFTLTSM